MKKVTVALKGRLGNQMFQYAFGRALSLRQGMTLELSSGWDINRLICFRAINLPINTKQEVSLMQRVALHIYHKMSCNKTRQQIFDTERIYSWLFSSLGILICENGYIPLKAKRDSLAIGYFQSEKYFKDFSEQIRHDFIFDTSSMQPGVEVMRQKIASCESVCLHIRLGDYINHPLHGICNTKYYIRAINAMRNTVKYPRFFVFTDDVNAVKRAFGDSDNDFVYIPSDFTDVESMYLGSNCRHFIMSNSSFSWWMCYLSNSKNNVICAPDKWYKKTCPCDIYMNNWTLIATDDGTP